ncbi:hypothetical protein AVEN_203513-1 [Araneus ventricosus]|uniref:Uncharacterized protein n=1 Tax=Araneus ventricosus TaxID=182803 RepID=A0A4Y2ALA2_ARAVE|nr:hypothetical protein AVEN_160715-1 [Araneus ventricosus]GBL79784.1 hypothetical protein AVEN_203513-1 [Araneus ventricosus]
MDMSYCRISKQELVSPVGLAIVGPSASDGTHLLREGSGLGQVIGYQDSGLSTRSYCRDCHSDDADASARIKVTLEWVRGSESGQSDPGLLAESGPTILKDRLN